MTEIRREFGDLRESFGELKGTVNAHIEGHPIYSPADSKMTVARPANGATTPEDRETREDDRAIGRTIRLVFNGAGNLAKKNWKAAAAVLALSGLGSGFGSCVLGGKPTVPAAAVAAVQSPVTHGGTPTLPTRNTPH